MYFGGMWSVGGYIGVQEKISHVPFHREGGIAGGFCDHHEDCCPETFVSWTLSFDGLLTWRGNGEIVLQQSLPRRLFNPPTMDCSRGVFK